MGIIGQFVEGWQISDFWIGKTEVTVQQFCEFLNSLTPIPTDYYDPRFVINGDPWFGYYEEEIHFEYSETLNRWQPKIKAVHSKTGIQYIDIGNYPMNNLTQEAALAYCKWAGGDLPTCLQWHYAARGSDRNPNATTEQYPGGNNPEEIAWFGKNSISEGGLYVTDFNTGEPTLCSHPVGGKKANFLGIYDMSGNVSELCKDRTNYGYLDELFDKINPPVSLEGKYPSQCGDSHWCNYLEPYTSITAIKILCATSPLSTLGFRIAYNKK